MIKKVCKRAKDSLMALICGSPSEKGDPNLGVFSNNHVTCFCCINFPSCSCKNQNDIPYNSKERLGESEVDVRASLLHSHRVSMMEFSVKPSSRSAYSSLFSNSNCNLTRSSLNWVSTPPSILLYDNLSSSSRRSESAIKGSLTTPTSSSLSFSSLGA